MLLLASAFALPPKVFEKSWTFSNRKSLFADSKQVEWEVQVVDAESLTTRLLKIDKKRDELVWITPSGQNSKTLNLRTRKMASKPFVWKGHSVAGFENFMLQSKQNVSNGEWEFQKNLLYFIPKGAAGLPLWNIPISEDLAQISVDKDRSTWMGLSVFPNKLYHLYWLPRGRRSEAQLEILNWDLNSELLSWFQCAEGKSLLVENFEGRVRINEFVQNPKSKTLDWVSWSELELPHATIAVGRSCHEIYVGGLGGITRLSR